MRGVSHAVEVLVLGLLVVVYKIPYSSCIFNTAVVVACVILEYLLMVSPHVVDIGSEYFVDYLSCVYIYVRLVMPSFLFFSIYFNAWHVICCPKREEALEIYKVTGEVLVLGLMVVVYKIPYSSCM